LTLSGNLVYYSSVLTLAFISESGAMLVRIMLFILLAGGMTGRGSGQSPHCFREDILIDVQDTSCLLRGAYYFANTGDTAVSQTLTFPVVIRPGLPRPTEITVTDRHTGQRVPCASAPAGFLFPLRIPETSIAVYEIAYRQPTPDHVMEYVLTARRHWKRTLEYAEMTVRIRDGLSLNGLSMPYTSVIPGDTQTVYHLQRKEFAPAETLRVTWRKEGG